jgi:hypothetical protein
MPRSSPLRRELSGLVLVLFAAASVPWATVPASAAAASDDTTTRHVVFRISSPLITESSSLVVSTVHPRLVYTANDSGDSATVYVLDTSTGHLVGRTTLSGVTAVDFEAMAGGSDGALVVGDIGDNQEDRATVDVYRIAQPGRGSASVRARAVTLTYADGPHDAESLLYDAGTGRVFVVSKDFDGAQVYRSPPQVFSRGSAVLSRVRSAPPLATDATFIDDGHQAVVRTYFGAFVYSYPSWRAITSFALPAEAQGESVTLAPGGDDLWIGSEGQPSAVLRVPLPDLDPPSAASGSPTTVTTTTETLVRSHHNRRFAPLAWVVAGSAAAALALVLAAGLVLHRRHLRS